MSDLAETYTAAVNGLLPKSPLLIVGQSNRPFWHRLRRGSVVDRLVGNDRGLDALVVSFDEMKKLNGGAERG